MNLQIDTILNTLQNLQTWEEKYELIIELGHGLPKLEDKYKIEEYKVPGCLSRVWIVPQVNNGIITFIGQSDSMIMQGLLALCLSMFNHKSSRQILETDLTNLENLNLSSHLSPHRAAGLQTIIQYIRQIATKYEKI